MKVISLCLLGLLGASLPAADRVYVPEEFSAAKATSGDGFKLDKPMTPPSSYAEFIKASFDRSLALETRKIKPDALDKPAAALQALALYDRFKEEKYRKIGEIVFDNLLKKAAAPEFRYDDFFGKTLFGSALILKKHQRLTPERAKALRSIVEKHVLKYSPGIFRFGNRELGQMLGRVIAAYQLYPDDPAFDRFRADWSKWWDGFRNVGALDESSGNYSSLGLTELVDMLEAAGRLDDLKSAGWREHFAIYRDMVSPSGNMPEFGDDYFEHGGKLAWIELFEFAARFYDDPTFVTAARKLFARHQKYFQYYRLPWAFHHDVRLLRMEPGKQALPEPMASGINYRVDAAGQRHPYMMILRPDNRPGSPMLMLDLYAKGDHNHMEKRSSILYYEAGHVVLNRNFHRHNGRQAYDGGNGIGLLQYGDDFPRFQWPAGKKLTVSIPAERFGFAKGNSGDRIFRSFQPDSAARNGSDITISDLRLEGPAGTKMIDGSSQLIKAADRRYRMKEYDVVFDPAKYSALKYEIRYSGGQPPATSMRYRDDSLNNYNAWHGPNAKNMVLHTRLGEAEVKTRGRDNLGIVRFAEFGGFDSRYTRSLLLLEEGIIVTREVLHPGRSLDGWTGGLTWQFYTMEQAGRDYFAGKVDEAWSCEPGDPRKYARGVLAIFDLGSGDEARIMTQEWNRRAVGKYTFAGKFPLSAGKPVVRTTLVIPRRSGEDVEAIRRNATFVTDGAKSVVAFQWDGKRFNVTISGDDDFRVERK